MSTFLNDEPILQFANPPQHLPDNVFAAHRELQPRPSSASSSSSACDVTALSRQFGAPIVNANQAAEKASHLQSTSFHFEFGNE
eukprot:CAMPEP_0196751736 /NCGR_PEP_ID=MMETSP1091-20130531/84778_1 /TAXON_ID=302021 /ORGANISM="Rhodomonas sp., Strain CCMP768" /LENGTH=83 /DNA_ID=CAMNT_0042099575 /DNA_START=240 /DNA_END=488 /DNA_ORIENTATION=-